jgi:hexosaminidase
MFAFVDLQSKECEITKNLKQQLEQQLKFPKESQEIDFPEAPKGYEIRLVSSATPQIIDGEGNFNLPLVDSDVQLLFFVVDENTKKEYEVQVETRVKGKYSQENRNNYPTVIPKLREWFPHKGEFVFQNAVVVKEDELNEVATTFIEDLAFFFDKKTKIVNRQKKGAVVLNIDDDLKYLGKDGYKLEVGDNIEITSSSQEGLAYGTKTVLQLINLYKNKIPKAIVHDYPKYKRRGFMLDVGRKFFKLQFLKDYVRIMSYYKMNEFHVHLNDNAFKQFYNNDWSKTYSAFRLESETYPGLAAKDGHYTKEEFRNLQKLGMKLGVNVIPEIDIPAHSLAFTQYCPSIGSEEYGMDHLDITKKETYEFCDKLFDEYLRGDNPVFIGPDVHIGTDEYSKKEAEAFRKFTDHYLKLVKSYGKTPRLWGALTHAAGKTPVTSEGVIMNAWYNGYAQPRDMLKQGYEIISTPDRYLYIVPSAGYYYDYLNLEFLYNKWEPNMCGAETFPYAFPNVTGGSFAVWNDHSGNGISEKDVHHRAFPAMQILAQKMWTGNDTLVKFKTFEKTARRIIEAPFVNVMANVRTKSNIVINYDFAKSDVKDYSRNGYDVAKKVGVKKQNGGLLLSKNAFVNLPVKEIGYNYVVDFEINVKSLKAKVASLFSNANAEVVVENRGDKFVVGFKRDGYYYKFKKEFNLNERYALAIMGDNRGTGLFVNGMRVELLQGLKEEHKTDRGKINKKHIQQTLVFPLEKVGGDAVQFEIFKLKVTKVW